VLLSPTVYDEMVREAQFSHDVTVIRRAMRQIDEGQGQEAGKLFDGLRGKLLAMRSDRRGPAIG
jgi:hypothetical protein